MSMKVRKAATYTVFVLPAVFFFFLVIFVPFVQAIIYSFENWNGISAHATWAGFSNYVTLFHDSDFYNSFIFTIKFVFISTVIVNVFGFLFAIALNQALKTKNVLRTVIFMPQIIGPLIIGFIWNFIFSQVFSQIGQMTGWSIFLINWVSLPNTAFFAIVLVFSWQFIGYFMIIYLAALQGVPKDIMESAEIDGASRIQRIWSIVLPLIRPAMTICIFLAVSTAFKMFDMNLSLTNGGPFNSTQSLALHIYREAFFNNNYTLGSAESVIFFLVIGIFTVLQVGIMKKKEVEM